MIYESECKKCGKVHEYFSSVDERNQTPKCCGKKTQRVMLTPPQVSAMIWTSHKSGLYNGVWCETGEDYKRMMKERNLISGKEGKEEALRARKRIQKEQEQKIEKAAIEAYDQAAAKAPSKPKKERKLREPKKAA